MNYHDERLLAEQLDAFLDELTVAPESLPADDAATASVLAISVAAMEPDPAFVARLEQRLRGAGLNALAVSVSLGDSRCSGRAKLLITYAAADDRDTLRARGLRGRHHS